MLEHATIIALLVLAIWYTMQEGEIFGFMQRFDKWKIAPALFACNVCMSPYYGTALYWLIPWERFGFPAATMIGWPITVITAMGINAALNKLAPKDDSDLESRVEDIENTLDGYGLDGPR